MRNWKLRTIILTAAISLAMILACACGGSGSTGSSEGSNAGAGGDASDGISVAVTDQNVITEVTVKAGATVADVLKEAGITLGDSDKVDPSLDTVISADVDAVTVMRTASVKITDGDKSYDVTLSGGTVADALKEAGITLGDNDHISVNENEPLKDGMTIEITHQKVIKVDMDGKSEDHATDAKTVQELLDELKVTLGENDSVEPDLTSEIKDGDKVVVNRVKIEQVKETEEIPFDTVEEYSSSMDQGTSEVTQAGVPGQKEVVYDVVYLNGKEVDRAFVSENVIKEPVSQIVTVGTYVYEEPEEVYEEPEYDPIPQEPQGPYEVSRIAYPNCADGSHGYYEITYSDGSVEYVEY